MAWAKKLPFVSSVSVSIEYKVSIKNSVIIYTIFSVLWYTELNARIRDILYVVVWLTWRFIGYCKSRTAAAAATEKVECWAYAFYWYIRRHLNQSTTLDIFGRALTHLGLMYWIYKWLTWYNVQQFFSCSGNTANLLGVWLTVSRKWIDMWKTLKTAR